MRAALYVRVSSDNQDVDLSVSGQLNALRQHAKREGYEIHREFIDEVKTGRNTDRPALKEMIALAKTKHPPFDTILVWKLNRFSRNRLDSITLKTLLRSRGIQVVSINEKFDNSPSGTLLEGIIEGLDEFYSANLGQDVKRGMRENAQRGFFNGSRPPQGLRKVGVVDGEKTRWKLEPEAPDNVARRAIGCIFDLALSGTGCKEIAATLNTDGLRTSTGRLWTKGTVHHVLTNEAYCGTLVWGGRPGRKAIQSGEPPIRVEDAWTGIVSREEFERVKNLMGEKSPRAVHPRTVPSFYLLSGLLYCHCGQAMIGRSAKSHRYYYYQCNRKFKQGPDSCNSSMIPKETLEQAVIQNLRDKVLTEANMQDLVSLVNEELNTGYHELRERLETIDSNNDLITLAANTMEKDSDSSFVYETGTFYLTINAANTQWAVQTRAMSSDPTPSTPTQTQKSETVTIGAWTGTGLKNTEPFVIRNKPWTIEWSSNPTTIDGSSMGVFQIMVYDSNNNLIGLAANSMERDSDVSYMYETGIFHLTINAANTNWAVHVKAVE